MAPPPRFSILICNYNYGDFVGDALTSALTQDYPADRFEVIVVDDGSTDHSRSVIEGFLGDPRVHAMFQENRGQSGAFEAAVRVASGDYVCLLDSDDLFLPDKLARVAARIAALEVGTEPILLCHELQLQDTTGTSPIDQTWFQTMGMDRTLLRRTLADTVHGFPFAVPAGLVFSRALLADILKTLPCWAFPYGTDGVVCHAAFLQTGAVHYLHETLGVYRIHGGNEMGGIVEGRYVHKSNYRQRLPKTLQFLHAWLDVLDPPAPQRALGLDYLRRLEHLLRALPSSRELQAPQVHIAFLGDMAARPANATPNASLQSHSPVDIAVLNQPAVPELVQIARSYAASSAEYLVFVRAGDRLDREFIERHIACRQHGALVGVSCSDVRLASSTGSLVHADLFRHSGAWQQPLQYIAPLTTTLSEWVAPPMSACLFRRNAILDRVLAQSAELPPALQDAGFWFPFQLQLMTVGALRIQETLGTCVLPDGAAAHYDYLAGPIGLRGTVTRPPVADMVAWLQVFYRQEQALFQDWLSPAWHQRFADWLAQHQ